MIYSMINITGVPTRIRNYTIAAWHFAHFFVISDDAVCIFKRPIMKRRSVDVSDDFEHGRADDDV